LLNQIVSKIKNYSGIQRKKGIRTIIRTMEEVCDFGTTVVPIGDDAGVIKDDSGYLLLAAEEINRGLVNTDPRWAGFCSILANVNDIYAMGGIPIAMVNTLSFENRNHGESVLEGIKEGCEKYRVPMVGGHFSPDSDVSMLTVSILGKAKQVLTSFDAEEGDRLIVAVDLEGKQYKNFLHWDSITSKTSEEVLDKLSTLPDIAENRLANAAKDISTAGILGTISMLLETSQKGGALYLDEIPVPEGVDFIDWLKMYPSFGFIVSASGKNVKKLLTIFSQKGYTVGTIGEVKDDSKLTLHYKGESAVLFDFRLDSVLG